MSTSASSWSIKPPSILNYAIAVLAIALTVVAGLGFNRLSGVAPSASLFSCAIMFVAWTRGTGPAILATALTMVAFDYFFLQPVHSFAHQFKDILQLALFAVAALFVVSLCAAQRRTAASLLRVRDERQATVRELQQLNETLRMENADRKRAEQRARRAEEELRATIDTIPALAARHRPDGVIDFVNQTWRSYTGLSQASWKDRGSVVTHPDDLSRVEQAWLAHLETGEPFETEQRLRRADGEYRWHVVRRVPLRNDDGELIAWYGAGYDIEDRKRAETALRKSEAQLIEAQRELQLTIDSIPAFVATYQPDGTRSFVNQAWQDYTGRTLQEATGEGGQTSIFHADDAEQAESAWRASLATGEPLRMDVRVRTADGHYRWNTHRRVPLRDENGDIVKWYSVGVDIEDQKIAEHALHAAQSALAHASRVATLGEISATIAHEVNQPLAAIVTNGQACLRFLRREPPDLDDVRGAVEWIVKDGNRAGEVIRRVRGLLKKADTRMVPLDVNDTINEVVALLQRELSAQGVTLRLELAPAMPSAIADRIQLQQVIINLVMNGVEAMQVMTGLPRALVIRSYEDQVQQLVVAVQDSGAGIPAGAADRLFDAFFSSKPNGLGIGLSICRSIIADHGGRLWATANSGGPGATFQFALPSHRESTA
jgi:PAS domain S-box-containing protein